MKIVLSLATLVKLVNDCKLVFLIQHNLRTISIKLCHAQLNLWTMQVLSFQQNGMRIVLKLCPVRANSRKRNFFIYSWNGTHMILFMQMTHHHVISPGIRFLVSCYLRITHRHFFWVIHTSKTIEEHLQSFFFDWFYISWWLQFFSKFLLHSLRNTL